MFLRNIPLVNRFLVFSILCLHIDRFFVGSFGGMVSSPGRSLIFGNGK